MKDDIEELSSLKTLYDELWSDAKTMIKDMKKSIAVYQYAGYVTIVVAIAALFSAAPYFTIAFFGAGNFWVWLFAIWEIVAAVVILSFAAKLLIWYRKLKKRYSKLIQLEKDLGD